MTKKELMAKVKPNVEIIGSVELISFADFDINDIPARVDTGAIFSSVWASDISLRKGVLRFKLFAPGNALYTGEVIKVTNFRTASVKNSFGQKEFRYKVRLLTVIGELKVRAWFTLADRSGMTYPVLLGRNILRNKFIVDVSQRKTRNGSNSGEVLVLASGGKEFEDYFRRVQKLSENQTKYTVRDYKDLAFSIKPGRVKIIETRTHKDIGEFDLTYFKNHKRDYAAAIAAAQYLSFRGVKVVDQELMTHVAYDKLSEYMRLALHNIPIPNSFCATTPYLLDNLNEITEDIGWPLVCKEIEADKGRKNYLVDDIKELKLILKKADEKDLYVLQQYIPNRGFIRALVFDRNVAMAIHRKPIKYGNDEKHKRHLNQRPFSDNAELIKLSELSPRVHDLAVRAAVTMNRQVAGVDILQETDTDEWFILEVNTAPQIKSGPFLDERKSAVSKFIDSQLNQ
jgi:glutathione synthase/RimK-type ligase-like ATP-grasp enzyme